MQAITGFVYIWTNTVNGKQYLGSHIGTPDDGYVGSGTLFQQAIKKYGIEKFSRILLEQDIPKESVRSREQYYLDLHQASKSSNFYNIAPIAGTYTGHGTQTRIQMSASIKKALTAIKGRKVFCYLPSGHLHQEFESISDAAKYVNGSTSNIKYTCDGRFKSAYGYLWSYEPICPSVSFEQTGMAKKVSTPIGDFDTISEAAKTLGINPLTLKRRIKRMEQGYCWI